MTVVPDTLARDAAAYPPAPSHALPHASVHASADERRSAADLDAMRLGATLYMPAVHPALDAIARGERRTRLRSIVVCLEDALHRDDVARGLERLQRLLAGLAGERPRAAGPRLFVRPRDRHMARHIAALPGIEHIEGFVVPKITPEEVPRWWQLVQGTALRLMPTLESGWVFDPIALAEFAAALDEQPAGRLVALRIGGNDLLASLRLRRTRGRTLHDGPLAWGLSQLMCQLGARGHALTAPVFDVLDDADTLARECALDAAFGFVGKTAVHPDQVPVIEAGFRVQASELASAREALAPQADAVFQCDGHMLEPAVHAAWAQRTLARAQAYGVID